MRKPNTILIRAGGRPEDTAIVRVATELAPFYGSARNALRQMVLASPEYLEVAGRLGIQVNRPADPSAA